MKLLALCAWALFSISTAVALDCNECSGDLSIEYIVAGPDSSNASEIFQCSRSTNVYLNNPAIAHLTLATQSHLASIQRLNINYGLVGLLDLLPRLRALSVHYCKLGALLIDPNTDYELDSLYILFGNLLQLPKHLGSLKKLTKLFLAGNPLRHIDPNDLNGLHSLRWLNLESNELIRLLPTSGDSGVHLPRLEYLSLAINQLAEVDFANWDAPSLNHIGLNENRLATVGSLGGAFPSLRRVDLSHNPLSCSWRDAILAELKAHGDVEVLNRDALKCVGEGGDEDYDDDGSRDEEDGEQSLESRREAKLFDLVDLFAQIVYGLGTPRPVNLFCSGGIPAENYWSTYEIAGAPSKELFRMIRWKRFELYKLLVNFV